MSDNTEPVMQKCMACNQSFNALMFSCPHCGAGGSSMMSGGMEMFEIMRKKQEATSLNDKAAKIYQQGNANEAVSLLQKALEINPMSEKAYENLGYVFLQEGRLEEAREALDKVLSINPRREEARRFMSQVKSKLASKATKQAPQPSQPQPTVTAVRHTPQNPGSLELPPQFDGKTSYRDMFRTQTPEQLRAMCDALPIEQLDLNRPGRPPTAKEMGKAITQVFAVATYMATKEVPTEYGDRLFPRLVAKITQYSGSDLHLELGDLVRDLAIHLEAVGRHKQAIQVMRVLRGSLFWRTWSQGDVCLFAALNNLALETKQKSDFQSALDFAQDLPPSQVQQFGDAINNLKQKMQPFASIPANVPAPAPPTPVRPAKSRKWYQFWQ